jgi:hypothetical protein
MHAWRFSGVGRAFPTHCFNLKPIDPTLEPKKDNQMKFVVTLSLFTLAIACSAVAAGPASFPAPGSVVMTTWGNNFTACALVVGPQNQDANSDLDVVLVYPENVGGSDNPVLHRSAVPWKALPWDGNPDDPITWDFLQSLSLCPTPPTH